jgi:hypothetical protein
MTIDDRTANINLPLPNQNNFLLTDVARLRDALNAIDTAINALDTELGDKSATGHGHVIADVSGLAAALAALAPSSIVITAGDGLTGGGGLTGNINLAMGTPGTLSLSSLNAVTADSHTHAVNFPVVSVNGKTGALTLTTSDITEIGNLYFTVERAAAAAPVQTVAGKAGNVSLGKVDVGLSNVDNTSDANKPVSIAVQNALGLKANLASPVFSGTPSTQNTGSSSEHTLEAANNGDYAGVYRIRAARGSLASKSAVLDGDLLGAVQFEAWDGAAYKVAARIKSFMSGAVGVNDTPGAISIETTPDGSAAPVQRLLITPDGKIQVKGPIDSNIVSIAANTIDCSTGTYFIRTLTTGAFTPVFSNPPTGVAYGFTLKLVYTGGTITWPASVKWANSLAPNFSTGKTHLIMFSTDDGGVTWRGAALMNYTG